MFKKNEKDRDRNQKKITNTCMFETQKKKNKKPQLLFKDIIQDNISDIKINTHHKKNLQEYFDLFCCFYFIVFEENILDFIFFDDWQDHGMVLKSCINRTDGNLSREIRSL